MITKKLQVLFLVVFLAIQAAFLQAYQSELVRSDRFDLMAGYIYAKYRALDVASDWPASVWRAHLNVLVGGYEKKAQDSRFVLRNETFNAILDFVKKQSDEDIYNKITSATDNLIGDWAAACLLSDKMIKGLKERLSGVNLSADVLKNSKVFVPDGLAQHYLDAMALHYCELTNNTYIALRYPCGIGNDEQIRMIFDKYKIVVVYEKKIHLFGYGPLNIVRAAYEDTSWIGNNKNNFLGARTSMKKRFPKKANNNPYEVSVILFECESLEIVRKCKAEIRALFGIGPWPIHMDDNHEETMALARTVFNENSIDFLNKCKVFRCEKFQDLLLRYKRFIVENGLNAECFCIVGDAVNAAYGIKDCEKLRFIHHDYNSAEVKKLCPKDILSSNGSVSYKSKEIRDDLIFNPANYFYYKNIKFAKKK